MRLPFWFRKFWHRNILGNKTYGNGLYDFLRDGHIYAYNPSEYPIPAIDDWWDFSLEPSNPNTPKAKPMYEYKREPVNYCKDWYRTAVENEDAFRAIYSKYRDDLEPSDTIQDVYHMFSAGDRYGIWTILDFVRNEDGTFIFSEEDIATLSGSGSDRVWKINENGEAVHVKNIGVWMS